MKRTMLSLSLLLASLVAANASLAAQGTSTTTPTTVVAVDPAQQIRDLVQLFRANDLNGMLRAALPSEQYSQLRQAYELKRATPLSDAERAKFAEKIGRFIAPDAVDQLMQQIEPKLVEARPQAAGALMMGLGALQVAIASPESELTPEQREALSRAFPGMQRWLTTTDFLSSQSVRQALTLLTDAARDTGISNLDQLQMLSFEEVLARASAVLAASKQALGIYGLDINAIAATTQVQVLEINGASARVRTTVTIFDAPLATEHELVLRNGRWYGKEAALQLHFDDEESES